MTESFVWRSCGIPNAAPLIRAVQRINDGASRASAAISDAGTPVDDPQPAADVPRLPVIVTSLWTTPVADPASTISGSSTITYQLVPVNMRTGKTGARINLPSLTIGAGQSARLIVSFAAKPAEGIGALLLRNGTAVGGKWPVYATTVDSVHVENSAPSRTGTYRNLVSPYVPPLLVGPTNPALSNFEQLTGTPVSDGDRLLFAGNRMVTVTTAFDPFGATDVTAIGDLSLVALGGPTVTVLMPAAPASGTFTNLSLPTYVSPTTYSNAWQFYERGQFTTSASRFSGQAVTARSRLDQLLRESGTLGGTQQVLEAVLGKAPTKGALQRALSTGYQVLTPTGRGNRAFLANESATALGVSTINVKAIRDLKSRIGILALHELSAAKAAGDVAAIAVFTTTQTTQAAATCPPGQSPVTVTTTTFVRVATKSAPLRADEKAVVTWLSAQKATVSARLFLESRGLSKQEASSALALEATGRLLEVRDYTTANLDVQAAADALALSQFPILEQELAGLTTAAAVNSVPLNEVVDDELVSVISVSLVNADAVRALIRALPRTPVSDGPSVRTPIASAIVSLLLSPNATLIDCQAVADLDDAALQALAPGLAVIDAGRAAVSRAVRDLADDLISDDWRAALDTLTTVALLLETGPLSVGATQCLLPKFVGGLNFQEDLQGFGDLLAGLTGQSISVLDARTSFFFDLKSLLCGVTESFKALAAPDLVNEALGVLDCFVDLTMPLDVQLAIDCNVQLLLSLQDLIDAAIDENLALSGLFSGTFPSFAMQTNTASLCAGTDQQSITQQLENGIRDLASASSALLDLAGT